MYFGAKEAIKIVADPIDDTAALEQALYSHALSQYSSTSSSVKLRNMAEVWDNSSENESEHEGLIFA